MNKCLNTCNLLTYISEFLTYKNIIQFSLCNKFIYNSLNPETNNIINIIYMRSIIEEYFEFEGDDNNFKNNKNLSGKFVKNQTNWKNFLKEIKLNFANYKDEKIKGKVKEYFKVHLYLPDLRKENIHLEYESSSIHQLISYDMNFRSACTYNFYSKYINREYIENGLNKIEQENIKKLLEGHQDTKNSDNNKDGQNNQDTKDNKVINNNGGVKILKEGLSFEKDLKNYYITFYKLNSNNFYKDLILNNIITYKYEELDNIYIDTFNKDSVNIDFINLVLWINHSFIIYSNFIYEYFKNMNDDIDEKIFLIEYVNKYNEIINIALSLNSNFNNINIIINQFVINYSYFNDVNKKESTDLSLSQSFSTLSNSSINSNNNNNNCKFSLYNLFLTIIHNNIYNKLKENIISKFKILVSKYTKDLFENKNKIDTEKEKEKEKNRMGNEISDYDNIDLKSDNIETYNDMMVEDDLIDLLLHKEPTEKEAIENFINSEVDFIINDKNANFINHTGLKVTEEYEDIENILINQFTLNLKKNIENEKSLLNSFEIIEKIVKCNNNVTNLQAYPDSFALIRRTKKNLMKQCIIVMFQKILKNLSKNFMAHTKMNNKNEIDFSLNEKELKKTKSAYSLDLSELNSKKRLEVSSQVDKEINNIKTYIAEEVIKPYEKENTKIQYQKIIDEYINYDGIDFVLLIKKILWFYYSELGLYEEKDEKVYKILKGKCSSSPENFESTNKSYINNNKKLSEENLVGLKEGKNF